MCALPMAAGLMGGGGIGKVARGAMFGLPGLLLGGKRKPKTPQEQASGGVIAQTLGRS